MSEAEREWRLIYSIIVAGKSAKFTEAVMFRLLPARCGSPFKWIREVRNRGRLNGALKETRTGNYTKLEKALSALVDSNLDLERCTPEDLEKIHGIGPKTARFFILWTRPGERYAALDVHVLRWMRAQGHDAPKSTPNGKKYRELEIAFLAEADKRGLTAGELDSKIWAEGSGYKEPQSGVHYMDGVNEANGGGVLE